MKKTLLSLFGLCSLAFAAQAQSIIDSDFEDGQLPTSWTATIPEGHTGGFSVVTYDSQSALKVANVGENTLGGSYVLLSKTGAKNAVKVNSDNWLISPAFSVSAEQSVLTFRLAANCSYSATKEAEEQMQMNVVAIEGEDSTVVATIKPYNYFTWKQYSLDLSAYAGKSIQVAFHDFGVAGSGAVADLKYIDNVKMTADKASDYSLTEVSALHGQAEYTAPYTIQVANYGCAKESFVVKYQIGEAEPVAETITSALAAGESLDYTFLTAPLFAQGSTSSFKVWVEGAEDAMTANDALAEQTITTCPIQTLPFAICNQLEDDDTDNDDLVETEFATATGSSKAKWAYDAIQYNAWIFSLTDAKKAGQSFLYTTRAYSLPAGKVMLQTIGTATLTDNYYEVYIAKYGAKGMNEYATKVGESGLLANVVETNTIDTTTVELTIPEAGDYVIAIRPMTQTKNAQMTIIGMNLCEAASELSLTSISPAEEMSYETMPNIVATFSDPDAVGYCWYDIIDKTVAETDPENSIIMSGELRKQEDGSWATKWLAMYEIPLLLGHTYEIKLTTYTTEDDRNYGNDPLAIFSIDIYGATQAYEYAAAQLESLSPYEYSVITTGEIVATFTEPVETLTAAVVNGFFDEIPCTTSASADKKTWTIVIPSSVLDAATGSVAINVYAKDAEGRVVQGNMDEGENSYFVWSFNCYNGCPEFSVSPVSGSTVEVLDVITASYAGGINFSYSCWDDIEVRLDDEVVCTIPQSAVTFNADFTAATITLPEPITEAGTYQVIFPLMYFMLGEEFSSVVSNRQVVEYTVAPVTTGINAVSEANESIEYNLNGQRVNASQHGIVIMNGKATLR